MVNEEIEKFNRIAQKWWDQEGEFKMLHRMNPVFVRYIKQFIPHLAGQNILDIGCGGGILCESLAKLGACLTGVDPADQSIEIAKAHYHQNSDLFSGQIHYFNQFLDQYIADHPDAYQTFDIVCCFEVLEHVDNPQSLVANIKHLLKPNGWIFFSTINRNPMAYFQAIAVAEYVLNLVEKGTHHYKKFIQPAELKRYCFQNQIELRNLSGIGYNLLQKQFFIRQNVSVNYICAYQL